MVTLNYSIHLQDVFALAKTLVIKSTPAAEFVNRKLVEAGYSVSTSSPETWKHHMNMCGEYHYTNTMMQVVSIDTQEIIDFTKANLAIHTATAKEYAYGSNFYRELESQYPDQQTLILGILNPVQMTSILSAEEGQILYYNKSLVEAQEHDLIPRLQNHINNFFGRWLIKGFAVVEDNYIKVFLSQLYATLVPVIEAIRFSNARTFKAHSFHIRQYLANYYRLDQQFFQLTHKQRMWLYFNIDYVRNNLGSQDTFDLLVQKILTDRSVPLSTYELVQSTLEQVDDLLATPKVKEIPVNMREFRTGEQIIDLEDLLSIVYTAARDNPSVEDDEITRINNTVPYSPIGSTKTKVYRSSIVDLSESYRFKLTEVLISSWIWLASTGKFVSTIPFTHPGSGETIRLRANDAFVALLYFMLKSTGEEANIIPAIQVYDVPRNPAPTFNELRGLSTTRHITKAYIDEALANLVQPDTYISIQAYRDFAESLFKRQKQHYYQWYGLHDFNARSQAERITMRIYDSVTCQLTPYPTFGQWLVNKGLNFDNLDQVAFNDMFMELLTNATGIGEDAAYSAGAIQRAMIEIMRKLSPYTVLFQSNINTEPFVDLTRDVTGISFGGYKAKQISEIIDVFPEVLEVSSKHFEKQTYLGGSTSICAARPSSDVLSVTLNNAPEMVILWKQRSELTMVTRTDALIEEEEIELEQLTPVNVLSGFNYPE